MNSAKNTSTIQKPFIEHVHELQVRLTWIVLFIGLFGLLAYSINQTLLFYLQKPLGQTLYYTSPTGGFTFLFKLCLVAGIVGALPAILYHVFKFMGPLLAHEHRFVIAKYAAWSFLLAYAGLIFAYFISLPSALHFLTKFGGDSIQSLISADEYFNFALAYEAGFAVLFQVPIFILFINRLTPLSPKKMMGWQRYVVLGSYIAAAILTPTPDPINQTIMALPAIVLYQVSIVLVLCINHSRRRAVHRRQPTPTLQPARQSASSSKPDVPARPLPTPSLSHVAPTASATIKLQPANAAAVRRGRYINDIAPRQPRTGITFYARPVVFRQRSTIPSPNPQRAFISDFLI
jgi:sec-independent protein translocase protein TatC